MNEDEFMKELESMAKPGGNPEISQKQFRLALMNTSKSAFWGVWFLLVPFFFLCCVVMKYFFRWNWGMVDTFIEMMADFDRNRMTGWLSPVLFVILPGIGALLNLLSVLHFSYNRKLKEFYITLKLKWFNIFLILLSLMIVGVITLYVITENAHHQATIYAPAIK